MSEGHVSIETRGEVALVRIDRPPANALNRELLVEVTDAAAEIVSLDPGAVVITGREGFFSAGVDLKLAPTLDPAAQRQMVDGINRVFAAWYSLPRPLVCAVNGHCIAGGLILALCGDHRVVARAGKHGLTELRAGIPYPAVAMAVVLGELSARAARRLVLGAALVDAEEATALGCYDEIVDPGEEVDRALAVATELAALPRSAYTQVKSQLRAETLAVIDGVLTGDSDPLREGWIAEETAGAAAAVLRGD